MKLIAISGKRRSGKSTLGDILYNYYGYLPLSLASPLKQMCRESFGLDLEQTDGVFKESPTHYKKGSSFWTPRQIMIAMGQFYRSIDPDYWVKQLFTQMATHKQAQMRTYVVTDVRFKNEMNWMKKHSAFTVRLERDEMYTGKAIEDDSETELDNYKDWDLVVSAEKNVNIFDLQRVAVQIHEHIEKAA